VTVTETQPIVETPPSPPIWRPSRYLQPRPEIPGLAVTVIRVLLAISVLACWVMAFALGLGGLQAERSHELLYDKLRVSLADETAPTGGVISPDTPVALITIPQIQLNQVIVEGTAASDLRLAPGHRRDTPLPGQTGTSVVYGRAILYGGPFLRIRSLAQGDTITVTTGEGVFKYAVDDVRRSGDPLPGALPTGGSRLTLVSAEGLSWRDGWAPDRVISVDATMQGTATPDQGGRPTLIPTAETALARDSSAWVSLVLWLQVLAAGAFGAAWAVARWGGPQAWLTFLPVVLVGLWCATDSALQLLPNLM
jgi:sortase A